mmetsp:Transcript_88760/g.147486  ORF Transcript_88760/g.147486 Transcript_88760/m.147486 type:complete len:80 (-) Transcript_88760:169-408(-)
MCHPTAKWRQWCPGMCLLDVNDITSPHIYLDFEAGSEELLAAAASSSCFHRSNPRSHVTPSPKFLICFIWNLESSVLTC